MASFMGTHTPRLDDKGRITLPAKYRDELATGLVMTMGQEHCLYVFSPDDFDAQNAELARQPVTNQAARNYSRMLYSGASDERPDKQGRVTIPPPLRAWAGLDRECVVIGAGNRIEIWDAAAWAAFTEGQASAYAGWSEEVTGRPN
jgi:MraZ protein